MVIVWGSIDARQDALKDALALSVEHVHRSRKEPGCLSHSVNLDAEKRNRLVFFEQWQDMQALEAHFSVPESGEFVARISQFAVSPPQIRVFDGCEQVRG